ncbi:hypothetical protein GCM10025783_24000 [Amnibacterium soli]|uniref:Uncharacterized protein n=1 Tax=Amnibacterium soli TaxID=1282736 RepID=A0ABP8ZA03_9MICO
MDVLVREADDDLAQVLHLGEQLRRAQATADREALRDLGAQRRDLLAEIADRAADRAEQDGHRVGAAVLDEFQQTLQAALVDDDAAAAIRTGRLVRGLTADGLEPVDLADAIGGPGRLAPAAPRPRTSQPRRAEDPAAQREAEAERARRRRQAEQHAADAERRAARARREADEAATEAHDAEDRAQQEERAAQDLRARLDELRTALQEAEQRLAGAQQAATEARDTADEAERDADDARDEADSAAARLRDLQD